MNNVKSIISSHNKSVISKSTNSNKDKKNCNCRKPETCPMDGNCNVESIIYQAEVTSQTTRETYIGQMISNFSLRQRLHPGPSRTTTSNTLFPGAFSHHTRRTTAQAKDVTSASKKNC